MLVFQLVWVISGFPVLLSNCSMKEQHTIIFARMRVGNLFTTERFCVLQVCFQRWDAFKLQIRSSCSILRRIGYGISPVESWFHLGGIKSLDYLPWPTLGKDVFEYIWMFLIVFCKITKGLFPDFSVFWFNCIVKRLRYLRRSTIHQLIQTANRTIVSKFIRFRLRELDRRTN